VGTALEEFRASGLSQRVQKRFLVTAADNRQGPIWLRTLWRTMAMKHKFC